MRRALAEDVAHGVLLKPKIHPKFVPCPMRRALTEEVAHSVLPALAAAPNASGLAQIRGRLSRALVALERATVPALASRARMQSAKEQQYASSRPSEAALCAIAGPALAVGDRRAAIAAGEEEEEEAGGAVLRSSVALAGVASGQACVGDTRNPAGSGHPDPTKERVDALQALSNLLPLLHSLKLDIYHYRVLVRALGGGAPPPAVVQLSMHELATFSGTSGRCSLEKGWVPPAPEQPAWQAADLPAWNGAPQPKQEGQALALVPELHGGGGRAAAAALLAAAAELAHALQTSP